MRDDVDGEEYPTFWHDFHWPHIGAGRMTTRLERRPPAAAWKLRFTVRPSEPPGADGRVPTSSSLPALAEFEVALPPDHGLPWPT